MAETNHRTDEYGGSYKNRMRFAVEACKRVRAAVPDDFIVVFRLSLLDLVAGGSTWEEVVELAHELERNGATIINSGIGWHEARVPTIATSVPRGGFAWVTGKLRADAELTIPVCATNRINTPEIADDIIARGDADLVSMARPLLADENFVNKVRGCVSPLRVPVVAWVAFFSPPCGGVVAAVVANAAAASAAAVVAAAARCR